ncbi:AsnC family protein, partial [Burkholderia pseudomallei]|uniref:AsnC family protein n=1 Tax=Burkholderia pseudomallei TaxID=28450 RepID=UPI00112FEBBD
MHQTDWNTLIETDFLELSHNMIELDKTDRAILAAVQLDGRIGVGRLDESVGLSETP